MGQVLKVSLTQASSWLHPLLDWDELREISWLWSQCAGMLSSCVGLLQSEVLYPVNMKHFIHQKELVTLLPSVLNVSVNSVAADQSGEGWRCWKLLGFVLSTLKKTGLKQRTLWLILFLQLL